MLLFQFLGIYHFCVPKVCRKRNSPPNVHTHQFPLGTISPDASLESGLVDVPQLSRWDLPPFWGFSLLFPREICHFPESSVFLYLDLLPQFGEAHFQGASWRGSYGHMESRGQVQHDRSYPDLVTQEAVELVTIITKLHPHFNKWTMWRTTWCAQKWSPPPQGHLLLNHIPRPLFPVTLCWDCVPWSFL